MAGIPRGVQAARKLRLTLSGNSIYRNTYPIARRRGIATAAAAIQEEPIQFPPVYEQPLKTEKVRNRREEIRNAKPFSEFLTDNFQREHDYLRISVTERCNLRCLYCMPEEGIPLSPPSHMLTTPEIVYIANLFVSQGVNKIRLTGGEPTVRRDIVPLMQQIGALRSKGLKELALTTNGISLHRKLDSMVEAGLTGVNLSLDTLDPFQFQIMTRRKGFDVVMKSIERILEMNRLGAGVKLKINCVVMRGLNEREILPFVELGREKDIEVRFIEYMPFGGNKWSQGKMVSYQEMLDIIRTKYPDIRPVKGHRNDTSKTWEVPGFVGKVGFITSMTNDFCGTCNRLRITSDGNLKVCLHGNAEVSLRDIIRKDNNGNPMDEEAFEALRQVEMDRRQGLLGDSPLGWVERERELLEVIGVAVKDKKEKHADMGDLENMENRPMILIDERSSNSHSTVRKQTFSVPFRHSQPVVPLHLLRSPSAPQIRAFSSMTPVSTRTRGNKAKSTITSAPLRKYPTNAMAETSARPHWTMYPKDAERVCRALATYYTTKELIQEKELHDKTAGSGLRQSKLLDDLSNMTVFPTRLKASIKRFPDDVPKWIVWALRRKRDRMDDRGAKEYLEKHGDFVKELAEEDNSNPGARRIKLAPHLRSDESVEAALRQQAAQEAFMKAHTSASRKDSSDAQERDPRGEEDVSPMLEDVDENLDSESIKPWDAEEPPPESEENQKSASALENVLPATEAPVELLNDEGYSDPDQGLLDWDDEFHDARIRKHLNVVLGGIPPKRATKKAAKQTLVQDEGDANAANENPFGLDADDEELLRSLYTEEDEAQSKPQRRTAPPETSPYSQQQPLQQSDKPRLTHLNAAGEAHMVDVSGKRPTKRTAIALGNVIFSNPITYSLLNPATNKKGDVLATARIAGIQGAKATSNLIPLCHPLPLTHASIQLRPIPPAPRDNIVPLKRWRKMPFGGIKIAAKVELVGITGVEMEALTAVSISALTIVDMCKAVDKGMTISDCKVVLKTGGKSGEWRHREWGKKGVLGEGARHVPS